MSEPDAPIEPVGTNVSAWVNAVGASKERTCVLALLKVAKKNDVHALEKILKRIAVVAKPRLGEASGPWVSWQLVRPSEYRDLRIKIESWWHEFGFADAIIGIARLWRGRLATRVLQCTCGIWFFGRTPSSKYCSAACSSVYVPREEAFKRRRRDYMREYQRQRRRG